MHSKLEKVLHNVFRFWILLSVLEIFALKVGRCPKLGQIKHAFRPQFFLGVDLQIFGPAFIN